jgi:hypothetical protein
VLESVQATPRDLRITIRRNGDDRYSTSFIGAGGKLLAVEHGLSVSYAYKGGEQYVRAVVHASNGDDAWTQPVFR